MVHNFIARLDRATGDYNLFVNSYHFGKLVNCETCHVFTCDDDMLIGYVDQTIEADMTIMERLKAIKEAYLHIDAENDLIQKAECDAENAWARHAERYDHEAQEDLALHDFLHPNGYGN